MATAIHTHADLAAHIAALVAIDSRFSGVMAQVNEVPLRRLPPGLAGLLRIVMGQQLSIQAAAAVWARLEEAAGEVTGPRLDTLSDEALRTAGLSRQKVKTLRALVASGIEMTLADPPRCGTPPEAIDEPALREALLAVPGIGPWTADLYLLVCAGAPDVFPVGDLALRKAAARLLDLGDEPTEAALAQAAQAWSPHRSTAARLLWAYYRTPRDAAAQPPAQRLRRARKPRVDDKAPV